MQKATILLGGIALATALTLTACDESDAGNDAAGASGSSETADSDDGDAEGDDTSAPDADDTDDTTDEDADDTSDPESEGTDDGDSEGGSGNAETLAEEFCKLATEAESAIADGDMQGVQAANEKLLEFADRIKDADIDREAYVAAIQEICPDVAA